VVDDDKSSRLLLVKVLASIGFELRQATNGLEAIALWESWEPHLILMDMLMPVMDGYEATRQIKAKEMVRWEESLNSTNHLLTTSHPLDTESPSHPRGDTVIIALTANAFEEDRAVILSSGCEDVVIKPFQEEIIFEKIARYLGVRYIYEEPVVMSSKARPQDEQHPSAQSLEVYLSQMPAEWVTQLYQAAALGSDCEIFQLIEQIPSSYAPLEHALMDWVNDFRFDRVINLIQQAKN
jgi:two-component system sensor histidine kinase/response regulator